ncbi:MAG TPA: glycosyltransferase family A protein [Gaiellaceae bacterium]
MTDVRLSIIVPTPGRPSAAQAVASAVEQMRSGDELLLVCDTSGDWGITPRNRAIAAATGTHLIFLDDDDVYLPGALDTIRAFAAEHPGRIGIFRIRRGITGEIPTAPTLRNATTASGIYVVPNLQGKVGRFGPVPGVPDRDTDYHGYEGLVDTFGPRAERWGDFRFIVETIALQGDPIWRDEVLQQQRPERSALKRVRYGLRLRTRLRRALRREPAPGPAPAPAGSAFPEAMQWAEDHLRQARGDAVEAAMPSTAAPFSR